MLSLNNISFEFGGRYLYRDATWQINPGEKIGLVGLNGTGKSTLLRIINGEFQLEKGEVSKLRNMTLGFLNQDLLSYSSSDTILEVAMQAFAEPLRLEKEIHALLEKMEHDHSEAILHELHDKQVAYEAADGYNIQHKAEALLEGLGFSTPDLNRSLDQFSGGWRMRVMLAKMMLQQPDLLLLDEPTNHLDLPSIQWVERYLQDYRGAVVVVSHDRYFLDKVATKTAEIANQKITLYNGNYSFYLEEKVGREELQRSQFKNQQQYIKEQEKLIDRFRAKASKAKMAQSRMKMLDKMDKIEDVESGTPDINIRFVVDRQPGKVISHLHIHKKAYGDLKILENTETKISRGDKIALIGANGRGKSTLLRMINGSEPFEGKTENVHQVIPAFYAQHQLEALNLGNDLITELAHFAPDKKDVELRTVLGAFLFTGDDVFKKIKVLSGGEKSRVALAKTMLSKANFLILDEPTNHLDMQSVAILISVLQEYEGSFIIVSHDRYFLSAVANKIWWIEDYQVKEYPGDYEEYEYSRSQQKAADQAVQKAAVAKAKAKKAEVVEQKKKDPSEEEKKKKKKLGNKVQQLEEQLSKLKQEREALEKHLSKPEVYGDPKTFQENLQKFNELEEKMKLVNSDWEKSFEELSGME
ncbi:MAG: ATP-binding cassette domain-containing protein [Bacteroidetes bacterium]|nr:ATP-binding cassette domain-containing protein [Bacteroidota bacterium]MBL0257308.1 ATP-binding cassette domain-containing protein [Bacteroidota bacterium]MBP6402500.1 ATP-binding cassette domain-containing protein [Bacteroidia bacterium]MBP6648250.1 ATP-binding cassette domain-containing protein [Bacteroidia bacterium]